MRSLVLYLFLVTTINLFANDIYFPPKAGEWETITPQSLNWDLEKIDSLYNFLETKNSKAFILLIDGKIVLEKYFDSFTKDSNWYWASAGKTLTSALVGIAQEQGLLSINDKSSKYLGVGWTTLEQNKEDMITIRHQLTMTSGLDDGVEDSYCTDKECLQYKSDAGTRWAYHNAPYTILDKVIENASGKNYNVYFAEALKNKIGMNGLWVKQDYNNLFISTPRSMARYGILILNKGVWELNRIIPEQYYNEMVYTSQDINKSYGYLWWLNGKESYMVPQSQYVIKGMLFPDAPEDAFAALGKNGQCLNVCPSKGLVFVRMGDAPGSALEVPWAYNNDIWGYLNEIMMDANGVEENHVGEDISIFPNPASDFIEVNFMNHRVNPKVQGVGVEIYNCLGECVKDFTPTLSKGEGVLRVNVTDLSAGLYFIKIGDFSQMFVVVR